MGREIRMVPPNWRHPQVKNDYTGRMGDQPMYDQHIREAFGEWLADFDRIRLGDLTDIEKECYPSGLVDWLVDYKAPDPSYYRPWKDEEATWVQLWQTVSEGSPASPPFATREELAQYLAANGDFWDQSRAREGRGGFSRGANTGWGIDAARAFVADGWAPSFAISGGVMMEAKDIPLVHAQTRND